MTPREALRALCEQFYDEQLVVGGRLACITALVHFLAAERAAEAETCAEELKKNLNFYVNNDITDFIDWCEDRATGWRGHP